MVTLGNWVWFTVVGTVSVVGYYTLPALGLTDAQNLVYTGFTAAGCVAILVGVAIHRPARRLPWLVLATAQLVYVIADGLYFVNVTVRNDDTFPAVQDAFYLAQYPLLMAALVLFIRRRTPGWHGASLIDAAVVATGVGLVWWVYLISPMTTSDEVPTLARLVGVAYPLMDLLVLAVALRLVLGAGDRSPTYHLLAASMLLMLVGDTFYSIRQNADAWTDGTWVDALWLVSYLLLGACALHPSMRVLDKPLTVPPPEATPARLTGLAAAALLAPTVLLLQDLLGTPTHLPAIAFSCATLFMLVLLRMAGLVKAQRRVAMTDSLTGLHARRFFEEALGVEAGRAYRGDAFVSVLLIDIDRFKKINDTYGHPAGDRVLREIADRLRDGCRPGDVVARYGGEEFAVLLPGASPTRAMQIAERIRENVSAQPLSLDDDSRLRVTVSLGAVTLPGDGATATEVIRTADRALYAAKRGGRNRVVAGRDLNRPSIFAGCELSV